MIPYLANNIMKDKDTNGLISAQAMYRTLFINTAIYARYKAGVDLILTTDGYADCIVTA